MLQLKIITRTKDFISSWKSLRKKRYYKNVRSINNTSITVNGVFDFKCACENPVTLNRIIVS